MRPSHLIHAFAAATTAVGFLAEPVPALDEILVVPMQYVLAGSIARARGENLGRVPWVRASLIIWGGVAVRFVSETLLRPVPWVGATSNALLTLASTELLGFYVDRALTRA